MYYIKIRVQDSCAKHFVALIDAFTSQWKYFVFDDLQHLIEILDGSCQLWLRFGFVKHNAIWSLHLQFAVAVVSLKQVPS